MTERPLKVLHVIHALGMGGAETWLMGLLRLSATTGAFQMEFLATSGGPGIFDGEAERLGARIHYIPYGRLHLSRFVPRFRQLLARGHYDAIHDHSDYVSGWHFLMGAGRLPAVRVTHVHNPWLHIKSNYAVTPLRRLATAAGRRLVHTLATDVCGTSAQILAEYGFRVGGAPAVSALHCGIEVSVFSGAREPDRASVLSEFGWEPDTKLVLFAGRLDRALAFDDPQNHKNSWLAINVLRTAAAQDPAVRLLMAGAGDDARHRIEAHVRGWGLQDRLRLIGVRKDMPRLMKAADVLFFPSRQEGLGMVAVEAQAAGLPVLASTAVPRECIVVPDLFSAVPLDASIEAWASALLHRTRLPRPSAEACAQAVAVSPFSIQESSRRLHEIYLGRAKGQAAIDR